MRLQELIRLCPPEVESFVDVSGTADELDTALALPATIKYQRLPIADAAATELDSKKVILAALGPDEFLEHDFTAYVPLLANAQAGTHMLALLGWPVKDIPYHRMLASITAASWQVIDAVAVERGQLLGGIHAAIVLRRVGTPGVPRPYLLAHGDQCANSGVVDGGDSFTNEQGILRILNEFVLTDFVTRPLRLRLRDLEAQVMRQSAELAQVEARLRQAESQVKRVMNSASYRIGRALVQGRLHPVRALVDLPRVVVQVWAEHRRRLAGQPPPKKS